MSYLLSEIEDNTVLLSEDNNDLSEDNNDDQYDCPACGDVGGGWDYQAGVPTKYCDWCGKSISSDD